MPRLARDDRALSPVVGAALLVAVVVVLSASIFLWLGAFGQDPHAPPRTLSLTSSKLLDDNVKTYSVPAATPGLRWEDTRFTLDGATLTQLTANGCPDPAPGEWVACRGSATQSPGETIDGGDTVKVHATADAMLRVLDASANSVIVSVTVR